MNQHENEPQTPAERHQQKLAPLAANLSPDDAGRLIHQTGIALRADEEVAASPHAQYVANYLGKLATLTEKAKEITRSDVPSRGLLWGIVTEAKAQMWDDFGRAELSDMPSSPISPARKFGLGIACLSDDAIETVGDRLGAVYAADQAERATISQTINELERFF